ncbi:hypothetical protein QBC43DRAFT_336265 [Cladorrhinum sp. PSN259]|nr:hypothetical protein QBC43DRAFT_336265 [Cladorrhinum sp. PSN259]
MKLGTFSVILSIAHLSTCAPLPVVVRGRLDVASSDAAEGTVTLLQTTSRHPSSPSDDHIRIPVDINPSILPPLTKHRKPKVVSPSTSPYPNLDGDEPISPPPDLDDGESSEFLDSENLSSFANPGIPYQYGEAGESNGMHAVVFAAAFLMFVIIHETWNNYQRRRSPREGTIRLEKATDEKRPPQPS